ncbi:hypothetical protein [Enterococcus lemanii]|jgi:uncharacterized Zn finger protein|uniref:SWIM-type domain-containing protein n=1 Tax=Enterococcus lemanii TaxID=1159752 RepID=A0ABV9MVQ7_9ENTE|nr:hypothetical protein [Enterococcus lemanii]MBM7710086.1 putative Zn finger protein [Enterococcus lemanii]
MSYGGFPAYVSAAEKQAKARKKQQTYLKKHPNAQPITLTGSKIAHSFWGKAWCDNLKYYADYDNRIGRGRSYIKNGFVFDLHITKGQIKGVVNGSGNKIYQVTIIIDPITDNRLIEQIGGHFDSLEELSQGQFPKTLAEAFLTKENGLFPNINEIQLGCTCPDWAAMCKHVSAILYAVGAKLDLDPLLLFELRGIDTNALIKKSVAEKMASLLKNAQSATSNRIIEDDAIVSEFGL